MTITKTLQTHPNIWTSKRVCLPFSLILHATYTYFHTPPAISLRYLSHHTQLKGSISVPSRLWCWLAITFWLPRRSLFLVKSTPVDNLRKTVPDQESNRRFTYRKQDYGVNYIFCVILLRNVKMTDTFGSAIASICFPIVGGNILSCSFPWYHGDNL